MTDSGDLLLYSIITLSLIALIVLGINFFKRESFTMNLAGLSLLDKLKWNTLARQEVVVPTDWRRLSKADKLKVMSLEGRSF